MNSIFTKLTKSVNVKLRHFSGTANSNDGSYSTSVKVMHWLSGGSMLACIGLVLAAQNSPKEAKERKKQLMYFHKSFGTLAFALILPRILIRAISSSPPAMPAIFGLPSFEHLLYKAGHAALYAFSIVLPCSGMAMTYFGNAPLPFFYRDFKISSIENKHGPTAKTAYQVHSTAGKILEYVIPVHVGAAFLHYFSGHVIFARIIPFLKATK